MGFFDLFRRGKITWSVAHDQPLADLIYVYLPLQLEPQDREDQFGDPLSAELLLAGLGEVSGGGSQLSAPKEDGTHDILFCGVDVDTFHVDAARSLLREHLPLLDCPIGTALHYRKENHPFQDEFDGENWSLEGHRSILHPGFGT